MPEVATTLEVSTEVFREGLQNARYNDGLFRGEETSRAVGRPCSDAQNVIEVAAVAFAVQQPSKVPGDLSRSHLARWTPVAGPNVKEAGLIWPADRGNATCDQPSRWPFVR